MGSTPLFNPNDGLTGRDGGPYLDEVQAQQDEIKRAKVEGREPNLDNPGANAGIQLSTAARMLETVNVTNNPSMERALVAETSRIWDNAFGDPDSDNKGNLVIRDEIPDTSDQPSNEDVEKQTFNVNDPNAPLTESEGVKGKDGQPDQPEVELVGESVFGSSDDEEGSPKATQTTDSTASVDPFGPSRTDVEQEDK